MFSKIFKKPKKVEELVHLPANRFSFMSENEQLKFQDEVTKYFERKYPHYIIDFSNGVIFESPNSIGMQYGLDTVAQNYHQAPQDQKGIIVKNHFDGLFNAKKEEEKILKDLNDFKKMRELLAIRLYPTNYEPRINDGLIYKEDIEGIYIVLVLDLPATAINVRPEDAEKWSINKDELFKIGLENVFTKSKITIKKIKLIDEFYVRLLEGDSIYSATFVLRINKYPELIGKYGSLVIVPHRHAVVTYPIENLEVVKMTKHLPILATNMFKEGPGSITPNLYWYFKGKFTKIPYELNLEKQSLNLTPPKEFIETINLIPSANNGKDSKENELQNIKNMFERMKSEAKWDMTKPMLWGYFFLDPDKKKLEALSKKLNKEKFNIVSINETDDKELYRLHIEEKGIHTPESLIKQNNIFTNLAKENDVENFDGWDVGPIKIK